MTRDDILKIAQELPAGDRLGLVRDMALLAALNAVQHKINVIVKDKTANLFGRGDAQGGYTYASLENIILTIGGVLTEQGLTWSWSTDLQQFDANIFLLRVICTVRHILGGEVKSELTMPIDISATIDGKRRNLPQLVGAARTYGARYTLLSCLGLATAEQDTDAQEAWQDYSKDTKWQSKGKYGASSSSNPVAREYVKNLLETAQNLKQIAPERYNSFLQYLAKEGLELSENRLAALDVAHLTALNNMLKKAIFSYKNENAGAS